LILKPTFIQSMQSMSFNNEPRIQTRWHEKQCTSYTWTVTLYTKQSTQETVKCKAWKKEINTQINLLHTLKQSRLLKRWWSWTTQSSNKLNLEWNLVNAINTPKIILKKHICIRYATLNPNTRQCSVCKFSYFDGLRATYCTRWNVAEG
jgi:hypothetical protein